MRSKRIIRQYATLVHWYDGLASASACCRAEPAQGFEWNEDERQELQRASKLFREAKDIVSSLYSKRIGEAVTDDVRAGTWKDRS